MEIPRRISLNLMMPAELAIREAMLKVEDMGTHPSLTDAVILLGQAKDKVSDWYDAQAEAHP